MDIGSLSRYYVDMCSLSRYCVDMSAQYLLCGQILLVPSSLPDKYPDTYGLIYQPLSRQNNLYHTSSISHIGLYSLWQLHHSLNVIFFYGR